MAGAWRKHPSSALNKPFDSTTTSVSSGDDSKPTSLHVDYLPRGECLVIELPHYGPLSHGIALARVLLWSWCRLNTTFISHPSLGFTSKAKKSDLCNSNESSDPFDCTNVRQKVPGLMQICDPVGHTITFLLPLEERKTMLPF